MSLEGKVAVVTGSSRGIGRAIALALAGEGADVVVAARTEEESARYPGTIYQAAEQIRALGRRSLAVKCDVTMDEDIANLGKRTLDEFGRADILVNNAGIDIFGPLRDYPARRLELMFRLNVRGPLVCAQAFLPTMIDQKAGHIINVSSGAGKQVALGNVPYGVTKAALNMLTLGMATEFAEHGIAANALYPGGPVLSEGYKVSVPHWASQPVNWEPVEHMAEAAALIASQDPRQFTGRSMSSVEVLREFGRLS